MVEREHGQHPRRRGLVERIRRDGRKALRSRGIVPRIARKNTGHGSGLSTIRWVVGRTFSWLHQFTRLRTRYEKRTDIHLELLERLTGTRNVANGCSSASTAAAVHGALCRSTAITTWPDRKVSCAKEISSNEPLWKRGGHQLSATQASLQPLHAKTATTGLQAVRESTPPSDRCFPSQTRPPPEEIMAADHTPCRY